VFVFVALVLFLVLPSPWNLVGGVAALVAFVGELGFWNRKLRGDRSAVGIETVVGRSATVISPCRPDGQVRLDGEIWEARCGEGADPGDAVVVTRSEGLTLVVARRVPDP
jgi:membrane protein implicated in regulation of membrane protease activity